MKRIVATMLGCLACLGAMVVASNEAAAKVEVSASKYRSFEVPKNFPLRRPSPILRANYAGTTVLANTFVRKKKEGEKERPKPKCMVIVVSGSGSDSSATAWPYRHSSKGTLCLGVLPHPEGGFFVRGFRADADKGDVAGFTARIGSDGSEKWLTTDSTLEASEDFKGTYQNPAPVMAYSASSDYLLATTIAKFSFGNLDKKNVTYTSIYHAEDGQLRTEAQTVGDRSGFGELEGAFTLESSGDFLIYNLAQTGEGMNLYRYDGRTSIQAFDPLGESWGDRNVTDVVQGPEGRIYILWSTREASSTQTRMAVVDEEAEEVWSSAWRPSVRVGEQNVTLETPRSAVVGKEHVAILYRNGRKRYLRVIDASSGRAYGVVQLGSVVENGQYVSMLEGKGGRIKVLTVGSDGRTFTETRLSFEGTVEEDESGEDAGGATTDAGTARPGLDAGGLEADVRSSDAGGSNNATGGDGGSGGGCRTTGSPSPLPLSLVVAIACFGAFARRRDEAI
jgi:hypothetical protein